MTFTTTGMAFLISALGLTFCGLWFSRAFRQIGGLRSGNRVGILLSIYFLGTAFQHGLLATGGFLFALNPEAHYAVLVIDNFMLGVIAALAVYLAIYILFPNYSPWPATIITLILGIFVTSLTVVAHPYPSVSVNNSIAWNMPRWVELPLYYLLLLEIGAPFLVFTRNFFQAVTREVRIISFFVIIATLLGLVNVSLFFGGFLRRVDSSEVQVFDQILGIIGVIFTVGFLIFPFVKGWTSGK